MHFSFLPHSFHFSSLFPLIPLSLICSPYLSFFPPPNASSLSLNALPGTVPDLSKCDTSAIISLLETSNEYLLSDLGDMCELAASKMVSLENIGKFMLLCARYIRRTWCNTLTSLLAPSSSCLCGCPISHLTLLHLFSFMTFLSHYLTLLLLSSSTSIPPT